MRRRIWWSAGLLAVSGVVATAVIGYAHTPAGRPLLPYVQAVFGQPKTCPLGMDGAGAAGSAAVARAYAEATAHLARASAKVIPVFEFGRTSAPEVEAYVGQHGGRCHVFKGAGEYECVGVKTDRGEQTWWASFDDGGRLSRLKGIENMASAADASARFRELTADVERRAGPPSAVTGSHEEKALRSGLLYQAAREYKFSNYAATVRVTNMGKLFAVTTHFYDPGVF